MTAEQTLATQVQWLVDRALISELLHSFARALDTRDWAGYAANYTADGVLELPASAGGERIMVRQADMLEKVPRSLSPYSGTHHISSNHQITIDGDAATSRSYLHAAHVRASPHDHWDAGGWYDCVYRRTAQGWKFAQVQLSVVWLRGDAPPITPDP